MTPRFANLVARLLAESPRRGGSLSGQGRLAIGRRSRARRILPVTLGTARGAEDAPLQRSLPRRQQLQQRQLLASRARLGLLPSSFSISGQTEKTLLKFATSTFPVRKTGVLEMRRDPPPFPCVSFFEP